MMRAKKSYGQNFLVDLTVVQKIIDAAQISSGETVLEVGPGTGVLTRALVEAGADVIAVEADQDLIPGLKKEFGDRITLIHGDVLNLNGTVEKLDEISLNGEASRRNVGKSYVEVVAGSRETKDREFFNNPYKVVANIPYNITSSLLEHFLTTQNKPSSMVLMLQKEVAERLTAVPPNMSLLSIVCQLYAKCSRVTNVKAGSFRPIPKVDSAVVKFDLYSPHHPKLNTLDPETVIALAKRGFSSKRKQLKTNLGKQIVPVLDQLGLDSRIRAEGLTVEQWIELSIGLS